MMRMLSVFCLLMLGIVYVSASNQSDQACSINPSCIVPQPSVSGEYNSLLQVLRDVQCEMGCIEQVCLLKLIFLDHFFLYL